MRRGECTGVRDTRAHVISESHSGRHVREVAEDGPEAFRKEVPEPCKGDVASLCEYWVYLHLTRSVNRLWDRPPDQATWELDPTRLPNGDVGKARKL